MKRYECYIFDVDDTLLNYCNAEKNIMIKIFEGENKNINDRILDNLWSRSCYWWNKCELDNTNTEKNSSYFSNIFISESIGIIKPNQMFWKKIFEKIPYLPGNCLMVGDSLINDVQGAQMYGIDTCWINRTRKKNDTSIIPTYEIDDLNALL